MASSIHTWYYYNYEITHRTTFRKWSSENGNTFLQLNLQYPNCERVNPIIREISNREKKILFCAERWHFLTPQLSASLSSNWEVQLNCCSNARWCKNFEATILNTVMHSVLRKAWKCLNFSEKCWKCRNYFKDTNFLLSLGDPTKRVLNSGIMSEIGCVAALLPFDLKNLGLFSYWHLARASLGPKTPLKHEKRG